VPPSAGMLAHLAQTPTYMCKIWKIVSRDGRIAAYANHTRDLVFGSVTYKAGPAESSLVTRKIGLDPDGAELVGPYDDMVTEGDIYGDVWADARVTKDWVCYRDLTLGSALTQRGFVGRVRPGNGFYTMEFRSLSSRLDQPIGALTSPIDRRRLASETGVTMAPHTHATTVHSAASRKVFKVPYLQPSADYFRYGVATFTSGANAGQEAEIKSSTTVDSGTRTQVELQKAVRSDIAAVDAVTLVRGYDGTRAAAKALGEAAMISFDGEPDMPLSDDILRYQP
jgi:uncharacterized phage protein (TIGR02218 family)